MTSQLVLGPPVSSLPSSHPLAAAGDVVAFGADFLRIWAKGEDRYQNRETQGRRSRAASWQGSVKIWFPLAQAQVW